jgi:hypothetical protein
MLQAWRDSGADRLDPVRFRLIEALARRAQGHAGDARRVLDDKLGALVRAYRDTVEGARGQIEHADGTVPPGNTASGPIAELVACMGRTAQRQAVKTETGATVPEARLHPDPALVDYFRETWIQVRASRELRHSAERVPENAGPLNSSHLVQRALSLMGEMSPGYLQQFLSYVDALSSLERLQGAAMPGKESPQASGRKSARGKLRRDGAKSSS